MSDKKYILTDETRHFRYATLHRIQAVKDFGDVRAGDLGGWVEGEWNLSHEGDCWIYDEATAMNYARVIEGGTIRDEATVSTHAIVGGKARIFGYVNVTRWAVVREHASVLDHALIADRAEICGYALVKGRASVFDFAKVSGRAIVRDNSVVDGYSRICADARLMGDTHIYNGVIAKTSDCLVLGPLGSRNDFTTFFRGDGMILVTCGCFKGTIDEFLFAVQERHGDNVFAKQYRVAIDMARQFFNILV